MPAPPLHANPVLRGPRLPIKKRPHGHAQPPLPLVRLKLRQPALLGVVEREFSPQERRDHQRACRVVERCGKQYVLAGIEEKPQRKALCLALRAVGAAKGMHGLRRVVAALQLAPSEASALCRAMDARPLAAVAHLVHALPRPADARAAAARVLRA